jgi:predicted nucleotidyltransferase/plasmid maintenance system antidote protein VapI
MSTMHIGDKLRKIREANHLPLRKVAAMIDIDVAILSKMERGKRRLTKEVVQKLAKIFKHEEEELMVLYLSEKVVYEIGEEDLAIKALHVAEEQIAYQTYRKLDKTAVINKIITYLKKNKNVSKAWIFGSFARGEDDFRSDIDLMIQVPEERSFSLFDLAEIQYQLELLIPMKIDLVMEDGVQKELMERIMPDLKLVYER